MICSSSKVAREAVSESGVAPTFFEPRDYCSLMVNVLEAQGDRGLSVDHFALSQIYVDIDGIGHRVGRTRET